MACSHAGPQRLPAVFCNQRTPHQKSDRRWNFVNPLMPDQNAENPNPVLPNADRYDIPDGGRPGDDCATEQGWTGNMTVAAEISG